MARLGAQAGFLLQFAPCGSDGGFARVKVAHNGVPRVEHWFAGAKELEEFDAVGAADTTEDVDINDIGSGRDASWRRGG